jgi:hypothetical protein
MKTQRNILVSLITLMSFLLVGTIGVGVNAYGQHSIDIEVEGFDCPNQISEDNTGCGRRRRELAPRV